MSHASQMVPRPGGEPTGPKKLEEIRLPTEAEVKKGLLDTKVEPKNALSLSEFEVMKFIQEIQTKFSKILETKAGLLAELRKFLNQERIDCEELVRTLERNYFKIIGEAINNLVDEIEKNKQIPQMLGVEAVKELIEKIQNLLYLDPEEDGDLINKLEAELNQKNLYRLETPLRFIAYCQLALISDGGKKLEQFKERVKAANNYEELRGLVKQILALKIMQIYPDQLIPFFSEKEAYKLKAEYRRVIEEAERQLGAST